MQSVLFICVNNSGRSQMAEAFVNKLGAGEFEAESAGLAPTSVLPSVVAVMAEEGVDLAGKTTQSVFDLFREGRRFDYVITVCDAKTHDDCPVFPGIARRMHLPFPDPAGFDGADAGSLDEVRKIRDAIKDRMLLFMECAKSGAVQKSGSDWEMTCKAERS